jgi:hypothetical protein
MKRRNLGIGTAATILATIGLGVVTASAHEEYFCNWEGCFNIAYSYTYYADAEKTEVLGSASDTCVQSGETVYAAHPYIPTAYYDETPMYVCAQLGPYLPSDWPY